VGWLAAALEFDCSCGARLRADVDNLFQIKHDMKSSLRDHAAAVSASAAARSRKYPEKIYRGPDEAPQLHPYARA
jgi:hypothetical protein